MLKKIFITGFMHSGTSILKSIIGHIPSVYELNNESKEYFIEDTLSGYQVSYIHPLHQTWHHESIPLNKQWVVGKEPHMINNILEDRYKDYTVILIMRNPLWMFSSMNRRVDYYIDGDIPFYESAVERFLLLKDKAPSNIHTIEYENMFPNNFKALRDLLDKIGLKYTDDIFNNTKYSNKTADWVDRNKITSEPHPTQHEAFRTYQLNQPFVNNNLAHKIDLSYNQKEFLRKNKMVHKLYPEVKEYFKQ